MSLALKCFNLTATAERRKRTTVPLARMIRYVSAVLVADEEGRTIVWYDFIYNRPSGPTKLRKNIIPRLKDKTARRTCGGNEREFGGSDRNIGGCYNGFGRRVGREKREGADDAVFLFAQTFPSTGGAVCSSVQREGGTESPASSFVGGRNCHR